MSGGDIGKMQESQMKEYDVFHEENLQQNNKNIAMLQLKTWYKSIFVSIRWSSVEKINYAKYDQPLSLRGTTAVLEFDWF